MESMLQMLAITKNATTPQNIIFLPLSLPSSLSALNMNLPTPKGTLRATPKKNGYYDTHNILDDVRYTAQVFRRRVGGYCHWNSYGGNKKKKCIHNACFAISMN